MITPEGCSSSSFPTIIKKTDSASSSLSISKFVDDIAVGNVTASAGAISCSAPNPRPTYLQALLGDNPPLLGPFNQAKERLCQSEDFPELVSTDLVSTKYCGGGGGGGGLFSSHLGSEDDSLGYSFSCSSLTTPYQRFVSTIIPSLRSASPPSVSQEEPQRVSVSAGLQPALQFPPEEQRAHQRGGESHTGQTSLGVTLTSARGLSRSRTTGLIKLLKSKSPKLS